MTVYAGGLGHVAWRCDQASKNVGDFLCRGAPARTLCDYIAALGLDSQAPVLPDY